MATKIYTLIFGSGYAKALAAFCRSVKLNSPSADLEIGGIDEPEEVKWLPRFIVNNNAKQDNWMRYIDQQKDGTQVVLIDCDTLVLRPLYPVFHENVFDVAYTVRDARVRYNSGVVFVKVGPRSRHFMQAWAKRNNEIVKMGSKALELLHEFSGANQRALHEVLAALKDQVTTCELPCEIWNCEQNTWNEFSLATAVLHVKSGLRSALNGGSSKDIPQELITLCRDYGY